MKDTDHSFENDQVEGWTPNRFAITFTRKMRKQKGIAFVPSIRSSLAIPKFLTARYFRTKILISKDYIEAAVLNTAYEDQAIAERVANEILFPKNAAEWKKKKKKAEEETQPINEQALVEVDPLASILEGLAGLQVDFDALDDLTDFDEMLEQEDDDDIFELFEKLYSSAHTQERSLAELMMQFGGPAEYHAWGAKDSVGIEKVTLELFKGQIGELNAQQAYHGSCSFMAKQFCQEAIQPWELASALAGDEATRDEHLKQHLDD